MEFLDEVVATISAAIRSHTVPDKSLKIVFKGLGVIVVTSSSVMKHDVPSDTTITLSRADFEKLAAGKLNPQVAFMQGKVKIDGDPLLALRWLPVIRGY
jgi:putative sterol carrier protein